MFRLEGGRLTVETRTLACTFERGFVTRLASRGGEEYVRCAPPEGHSAVELLYRAGEAAPTGSGREGRVEQHVISGARAEILFSAWDADGALLLSEDEETGALVVEPSAYSTRPGVRAVRWHLVGIARDLELVAPFFQGARLGLADPLLKDSRWMWPHQWEAQLVVLARGERGGLWLHARDDRYRYKALVTAPHGDAQGIALDTETYGPIDNERSSGGLAWRLNVYEGGWQAPVDDYREWASRAFGWDAAERARPEWTHGIRFAVSWCPCRADILDAIAARLDPGAVLLHVPGWRTDGYDENYPTYVASAEGRAFIAKARAQGFRVMPHMNSVDMDPSHPVFHEIADFIYRDIETGRAAGWSWDREHGAAGPPNSARQFTLHRAKKSMVKVHPGLARWRQALAENVWRAAEDLSLDAAFLDVTLCTWNLANSIVDGMTSSEGMARLLDHVGAWRGGLVLGGEGMNETTAAGLAFAQAHLFRSWQDSAEGLERAGGTPVNARLFGRFARTFGYSNLSGRDEKSALRMRVHESLGTIPTVTIGSGEEIAKPNPAVARALDIAASS